MVRLNLIKEQTELCRIYQAQFWLELFTDTIKEHTYQKDFFLLGNKLPRETVAEHLAGAVYDLCHIYGLQSSEIADAQKIELYVKLDYYDYGEVNTGENSLFVIIKDENIALGFLPENPVVLVSYPLEEFKLVENIIKDVCNKLYVEHPEMLEELHKKCERIMENARGLTAKSIEIAQNSIKVLYDACDEADKNLVQRCMYSSFVYHKRTVRIFHKEFMKDPNVMLKELN